jgi:hypothetical protein
VITSPKVNPPIGQLLKFWKLKRDRQGDLVFLPDAHPMRNRDGFGAVYCDSLLKYLNILDIAYCRALNKSEFELVHLLLRIRGMETAGWDPFESTKATVRAVRRTLKALDDLEAERTLQLWIYGHIVEASELYDTLMNLADIVEGGRYSPFRFPPSEGGRPQSPGEKIRQIEARAQEADLPDLACPLRDIWDRTLRNAIFHSDYALKGNDITIRNPMRVYTHEQIMTYLNRALAFHDALISLDTIYRGSFNKPRLIPVHPGFAQWPGEKAWVMVREDYGAMGLRDAWSADELKEGKIPWCMGRFFPTESEGPLWEKKTLWFPKNPAPRGFIGKLAQAHQRQAKKKPGKKRKP